LAGKQIPRLPALFIHERIFQMVTRPLSLIKHDPPPYLDAHKVDKFIDLLKRGTRLTPIAVYQDGDRLSISHGFHRFQAHRALGRTEIEVDVVPGPWNSRR
jgi:uncharacterized ParB-like nuclease family protein